MSIWRGLWLFCSFSISSFYFLSAQTEGDTGYDYSEAYLTEELEEEDVMGFEPSFDVPQVNVTVVEGQTAVLPCQIEFLGKYKVTWVDPDKIPLAYEDRRVVDDPRFSIVRPYMKEWNLRIQDVQWTDQGDYRCVVNTQRVREKVIMLHVKVPAQIIDSLSSEDVTVEEGDTVVLVCNTTGVPRPDVTWYRRPAQARVTDKERIGMKGEMIIIQNVSRYCDDIYECVADNGVPPAVSRQMRVTVEFPPEIELPNRRMGQMLHKNTILECIITAFPISQSYWLRNGRKIQSSSKFRIEAYDDDEHTVTLSLRIGNLQTTDYGDYSCMAHNKLGSESKSMILYEYIPTYEAKPSKYTPQIPVRPLPGDQREWSPWADGTRVNGHNREPSRIPDENMLQPEGTSTASSSFTAKTRNPLTLLYILAILVCR